MSSTQLIKNEYTQCVFTRNLENQNYQNGRTFFNSPQGCVTKILARDLNMRRIIKLINHYSSLCDICVILCKNVMYFLCWTNKHILQKKALLTMSKLATVRMEYEPAKLEVSYTALLVLLQLVNEYFLQNLSCPHSSRRCHFYSRSPYLL